MNGCPCGSESAYKDCCKPFIDGEQVPATAELLMRSRYTAYTKGSVDYILETHSPEGRDELSREATEKWAKSSDWMGLEILNCSGGRENDRKGTVEFIARYRDSKRAVIKHHEISQFEKADGRWFFKEASLINNPQKRETPKPGRNAPCPCGSGKKFKHCCGA